MRKKEYSLRIHVPFRLVSCVSGRFLTDACRSASGETPKTAPARKRISTQSRGGVTPDSNMRRLYTLIFKSAAIFFWEYPFVFRR